jgi:2-amino-4-hydroxy-6-hydroxymethyldihydropteridine diphosphokinase
VSKIAYFSLGSNLGDREQHLRDALDLVAQPRLRILRVSSFYETEPQDVPGQPWFLNAVAEAETDLFPKQVLFRVHRVEKELGRTRSEIKAARTIDVDILLYGAAIIDTDELIVPHPRLAERRFVLEPLAELAPNLRHPITGRSVAEMLKDVAGQRVRKL